MAGPTAAESLIKAAAAGEGVGKEGEQEGRMGRGGKKHPAAAAHSEASGSGLTRSGPAPAAGLGVSGDPGPPRDAGCAP